MNRRTFIKRALQSAGGFATAGIGAYAYGRFEAHWLHVVEATVPVQALPPAFDGLRIALFTDPHLGPYNPTEYLRSAVDLTNSLAPDLIAVAGDFAHGPRGRDFVRPCLQELSRLRAPLGVFAVPGNHDHWDGITAVRRAIADNGLIDVTNAGVWLERRADRLRLGGVDDWMCGRPDATPAVGDTSPDEACLLLSHNPEFAEGLRDPRVRLMLSGHMHGGQIVLPGVGYRLPAKYGTKYLEGLVRGPVVPVFVSRGIGVIGMPLRVCCRPEVNLLTLRTA